MEPSCTVSTLTGFDPARLGYYGIAEADETRIEAVVCAVRGMVDHPLDGRQDAHLRFALYSFLEHARRAK